MNLMICMGLISVNGTFLVLAKHPNAASGILRKAIRCKPTLLFAALVLLATTSFLALLQWVSLRLNTWCNDIAFSNTDLSLPFKRFQSIKLENQICSTVIPW